MASNATNPNPDSIARAFNWLFPSRKHLAITVASKMALAALAPPAVGSLIPLRALAHLIASGWHGSRSPRHQGQTSHGSLTLCQPWTSRESRAREKLTLPNWSATSSRRGHPARKIGCLRVQNTSRVLFLKRSSDIEDERQNVFRDGTGQGKDPGPGRRARPNRSDFYTDSFFVPEKAALGLLLNEVPHNRRRHSAQQSPLALEEANTALEPSSSTSDFTRKVGQSSISDQEAPDLVVHFFQVTAFETRDFDFLFPDLLGAAYEYLVASLLTRQAKKGGRSSTHRDPCPDDGPFIEPREASHLRPGARARRNALSLQGVRPTSTGQLSKYLALFGPGGKNGESLVDLEDEPALHGIPDRTPERRHARRTLHTRPAS